MAQASRHTAGPTDRPIHPDHDPSSSYVSRRSLQPTEDRSVSWPGTQPRPRSSNANGAAGVERVALDLDGMTGEVETAPAPRGKRYWPWLGRVRRYIYVDFAVYLALLVTFCVATLSTTSFDRSYDAYHLVRSVQKTLLEEFRPEPEVSFHNIQEKAGLRHWLRNQFLAVMYGFNPNGGELEEVTPQALPGFYLASTSILGPIRLRQARVRANSCEVLDAWKSITCECHAQYSGEYSRFPAGSHFSVAWPPFDTRSDLRDVLVQSMVTPDAVPPVLHGRRCNASAGQAEEVELIGEPEAAARAAAAGERAARARGLSAEQWTSVEKAMRAFEFVEDTRAGPYSGRLATPYWERGFVADLPMEDVEGARRLLDLLEAANWLDAQTRALFIEFSLYLPSADLLLAARLVIEVHASGTTWTDSSLEPVSLAVYRSSNRLQMAIQILTAVTALVAIVWEIWHTAILRLHHGLRAGSAFLWTAVGLVLYGGMLVAISLHFYNVYRGDQLAFEPGRYLESHRLGYFVAIERALWSVLSFAVWFRLLKFTSQLPKLGILGRTIGRVVPQIAVFFLISCVIFLAFAQCFYMAYYASVPGYQTFPQALMSVLRFTVLDFDYDALSRENRILTPILFTLLLLIVFFVWVNVIVAIISEVYTQEVERSLFVEWDPDFASMALDAPQPENDVAAMVPHQPVHTVAGQAAPAIVALTPFRFERVRFAKLKHFDQLVTMDVFGHMKGAHAAACRAGGGGGDGAELPPWPIPGSHNLDELYPAVDFAAPPRARGDGGGEGVLAEELLIHRGIYARLGTYARQRRHRVRGQAVPHVDGHMELQALYFDKAYHNLTTARLWWDEHKHMFDPREKLMTHALQQLGRPFARVARGVRERRARAAARKSWTGTLAPRAAAQPSVVPEGDEGSQHSRPR